MLDWRIILAFLLIVCSLELSRSHSYQYTLTDSTVHEHFFTLQAPTRLTFIQQTATATITIFDQHATIASSSNPLQQFTLDESYLGRKITVRIQGHEAVGRVEISPVQQFELLGAGEQKLMHIKNKQFRTLEIHPRRQTQLVIQKISGTAQFTNNRCKSFQKIDCYNQLPRLSPILMSKSVEVVQLEYCSNCILLVKIEAVTAELRLRLYIDAAVTVIDRIPAYSVLKQGQVAKFIVYGKPNFRGKIINFAGSVKVESLMKVDGFSNGMFYQLQASHELPKEVQLVVRGMQKINFFAVQTTQNQLLIKLKDGSPTTIRLQGGNNYTVVFEHKKPGRGNFVISGNTELMNRLSVHFLNKENNQRYSVRPHYLFNASMASQNFQLDNSTGDIQLELRLLEGFGGYLNVGVTVEQPLVLPLDYRYSSILGYNEEDHYILQGLPQQVELSISKCVECQLQVKFQSEPGIWQSKQISERNFNQILTIKDGALSLIIKTNNYAYYSLSVAKRSKRQRKGPKLVNTNVSVYLTQTDNQLQLQFQPPICLERQCKPVKYYIVEGSDRRHVASRAYCPNTLFDFDERTKNIIFKEIEPLKVSQNLYSYTQPLVANDWVAVAAEVNNQILSYDIVNAGEIRVYKSMRWPIFYISMFVTFAAFLSFVIFMGLKRRKAQATNGYIRGSASCEQLD